MQFKLPSLPPVATLSLVLTQEKRPGHSFGDLCANSTVQKLESLNKHHKHYLKIFQNGSFVSKCRQNSHCRGSETWVFTKPLGNFENYQSSRNVVSTAVQEELCVPLTFSCLLLQSKIRPFVLQKTNWPKIYVALYLVMFLKSSWPSVSNVFINCN